jgi:hypothetical protein
VHSGNNGENHQSDQLTVGLANTEGVTTMGTLLVALFALVIALYAGVAVAPVSDGRHGIMPDRED